MRYKNIIIKSKNVEEFIQLQKHLFKLSYSWYDYGNKNRQIKKIKHYDVLIQNDDRMIKVMGLDDWSPIPLPNIDNCKIVDFVQLVRKEKLKKINNG